MTTSQNTWSTSNNEGALRPSETEKAYSRAKFRRQVHDQILAAFLDFSENDKFARSTIADLLEVNRSQITRWLASPNNLRLDTISDLLLAMSYKPVLHAEKHNDHPPSANFQHKNSTLKASGVRTEPSQNAPSASREPNRVTNWAVRELA